MNEQTEWNFYNTEIPYCPLTINETHALVSQSISNLLRKILTIEDDKEKIEISNEIMDVRKEWEKIFNNYNN